MIHQPTIGDLSEQLWQEEKKFLIAHYARLLVDQVEADEVHLQLESQTVQSLLVARLYVDPELKTRIANLFLSRGEEEQWQEAVRKDGFLSEEPLDETDYLDPANALFDNDDEDDEDNEADEGDFDQMDALFDDDDEDDQDNEADEGDFDQMDALFDDDDEDGNSVDPTPSFDPTIGHENEDTPGFEGSSVEEKGSKVGKRKPVESASKNQGKKSAKKRKANAQEKTDQHAKRSVNPLKGKEEQSTSESQEEDQTKILENISYLVSVDNLEQELGLQIIPEDRKILDKQLSKKLRDPTIIAFIKGAQEEGLTLAMLPRLPRFVRRGQLFKVTGANLVRSYPQHFANVQQIVLKLRTEPFFLQETPKLDWAIITSEALPDSLEKNYTQQKQAIKTHAQRYNANNRQVHRRNLPAVLYDLIAVQLIHHQNLLSQTADLTESRIGRQNQIYINFGENGIRISDINRHQTHPQLGVCPSW